MISADQKIQARFNRVNRLYFDGKFTLKAIKWSKTPYSLSRKKHCWAGFSPEQLIVINICLLKICPNYVLEYLIFHECLHRYWDYHCQSFRKAEQRFRHYRKAEAWLKKNESLLDESIIKAGRH